jgi:membrane associated rhomboid family serine protease
MNTILIAIIIVNALISFKGFNDQSFFRKYEFHMGSVRAGEQIRLISSAFLHADIAHLAFNMITLYAPVVIGYLGSLSFVIVYFGSLVCGSLLTILFQTITITELLVPQELQVLYSAILLPDMMLVSF